MQALADYAKNNSSAFEVGIVIADGEAAGLKYANEIGIKTKIIDHEQALIEVIESEKIDLICLAGYMRILSSGFCARYPKKIINIHPSLLPKYKGLDTHQRALEDGEKEHGCSVHFVTPELDGGEVIEQASVTILPNDTPETLAERVLAEEHKLYPQVVEALAKNNFL